MSYIKEKMPIQTKKNILLIVIALNCFLVFSKNPLQIEENKQVITRDSLEYFLNKASKSINTANLQEALNIIITAQELAIKRFEKNPLGKADLILAHLFTELGDLKIAEIHIKKAIERLKVDNKLEDLAKSYNLYGNITLLQNKFDQSAHYLNKAFELVKNNNLEHLESNIYLNQGKLQLAKKQHEESLTLFEKGLKTIDSTAYNYTLASLHIHKAKALISLNKIEDAIIENDIAMRIAKNHKYRELISESLKLYSQAHEKNKDYQIALNNLKIHQKFKDSLFNTNKEIIAQEANAKLNLDESNFIIEELTEQTNKQQKSLQMGKLTMILSIALITILSLLTLSLYKNNNLRARANELLQNKNTELILAKENAERASEAKVQFLSTITHELRTPLYAVTGLTHLLLEESPTPNQKEHLNSLKFSGEYLLSLINNILDLNKLEANKVELENTTFNLQKRINDVLIALGKSAKDRNNELHYEFDKGIPSKLKGDPLKISQILINLIGNSIKFTQNGDIWIRVKLSNQLDNKVYLHFEIEDNGVGISEKKQKSIFENFTQGSVQINRKFGGTGLGLSIVKNLLNLMDSKIRLESELGKGSKFYFDLKFDVVIDTSINYNNEIKKVDHSIMKDKYVLVVEDNKINQLITRKILEKNNMKCDVADNGDIAIEKAKDQTFDLILMDIHMPGISGIEATKMIREFDKVIPIVALTAVTLDDNLDEFYNNGFDDIIPKPYKTEEFFTKLHRAFSKNKVKTNLES